MNGGVVLEKLINLDNLEIGMVLGEDAIDTKSGAVLIPKGKALTGDFIDKLSLNNISEVIIVEEEIPEEWYNNDIRTNYLIIGKKLENLFYNAKKGKKIEVSDIFNEMDKFAKIVSQERDILTQMRLLRKKDDYTFDHSMGVSILAISLGKWLNYSEDDILNLSITGLFHDIGKLHVSDEIVKKPGRLTEDECEIMKKHSYYGYQILMETGKFSNDILMGVLQHHERMDGSGYPNGLKGDKIHEYAKVVSICDIYHAITSRRVYKDKESPFKAADQLRYASFSDLDPTISQVFLENISNFYIGNKVLLSNGDIGTIVYVHPQDKTKAIVKVDDYFIDFLKEHEIKVLDIII